MAKRSGQQGKAEAAAPKAARRPGRPHASEGNAISRDAILKTALKLSQNMSLQDLSIVTVARAMKVTPALIHYYIGGRDWLTSGIMNLFYKELLRKWPEEAGDWRIDLMESARVIYDSFAKYGGVAAYAVANSRFRVFQLTAFGDRDYGVLMLEKFTGRVRASGLSGERTGIYTNQFIEFIISTGHGASHHLFPAEHRKFLDDKIDKLDPEKHPNVFFARKTPITIDGLKAFEEGCQLFLLGIITELKGVSLTDATGWRKPLNAGLTIVQSPPQTEKATRRK